MFSMTARPIGFFTGASCKRLRIKKIIYIPGESTA
jgi:hypothetical protein